MTTAAESRRFSLQDLIDDLKSELSSNFEQVILGLMTPTVLYDVQELRRAMKVSSPPRTLGVLSAHGDMLRLGNAASGAGEEAQWLGALTALLEDCSVFSNTHAGQLQGVWHPLLVLSGTGLTGTDPHTHKVKS